jgi:chromosome segregation ATPase
MQLKPGEKDPIISHAAEPKGQAAIEVTFKNEGPKELRLDLSTWGTSIKIRCDLVREASGVMKRTYTFTNGSTNKEIRIEGYKPKDLLKDFQEKFNLYADNPVTIMDQDTSKQFVQGKPKDLYGFWIKGTYQDRVFSALNDSIIQLKEMDQRLEEGYDELKRLKSHHMAESQEFHRIENIIKMGEKVEAAQKDLVWAGVCEIRAKLEKAEKDVEAYAAKAKKLEPILADAQTKHKAAQDEAAELE